MSLIEILVATALTVSVMGGVLAALGPAQAAFVSQSDAADARQRMRVGVEAIRRDLLVATDALPFAGGILIVSGAREDTYYTKAGTLRHDDGMGTDLPVVDGVSDVVFERVSGRRIQVRLRMQRTRWAPAEAEIVFDVTLRN